MSETSENGGPLALLRRLFGQADGPREGEDNLDSDASGVDESDDSGDGGDGGGGEG